MASPAGSYRPITWGLRGPGELGVSPGTLAPLWPLPQPDIPPSFCPSAGVWAQYLPHLRSSYQPPPGFFFHPHGRASVQPQGNPRRRSFCNSVVISLCFSGDVRGAVFRSAIMTGSPLPAPLSHPVLTKWELLKLNVIAMVFGFEARRYLMGSVIRF